MKRYNNKILIRLILEWQGELSFWRNFLNDASLILDIYAVSQSWQKFIIGMYDFKKNPI